VKGDGYVLRIRGTDIVNYENEVYTDLKFEKVNKETEFILNKNNSFPGKVSIFSGILGYIIMKKKYWFW